MNFDFKSYSFEQLLSLQQLLKSGEIEKMVHDELCLRPEFAKLVQDEVDKPILESIENYNKKLYEEVYEEAYGKEPNIK